jgi:outer membrane protein, heavy metal efflux system
MRHAAVATLALLLALPAGAQTPPPSLRSALELAREHSPRLQAASAARVTAHGRAAERAAFSNPVLEMRQENLDSPLGVDRFTTLTLPLDLTWRRGALRATGREEVAAASLDSIAVLREVEADVAVAFLSAALAGARVDAARTTVESIDGIAAFEETRLREGAVAEGVVIRTRLERDRLRLDLARAEAEAERAHARLAEAVGLPPERVPRPGGAQILLAAVTAPEREGVLERAVSSRPDLAAARRRTVAARHALAAEWRATLPDVGLQLGAKQTGGYNTGIVAVALTLPLPNTGGAARERARGEVMMAEAAARLVEERIRAEVTAAVRAYERLLAAGARLSEPLAGRGEEIARIAEAAYREGAISLVELLDAQRARADALAADAEWRTELALARVALLRAAGASILEEEP